MLCFDLFVVRLSLSNRLQNRSCLVTCTKFSVKMPCTCPPRPLAGEARTVYNSGPLLETVQMSGFYKDSKTFVDMKMRYPPEKTLVDFQHIRNEVDTQPEVLEKFVKQHFEEKGSELESWTPTDWKPKPPFLERISDPELKKFGNDLNALWKQLGRRIRDDVKDSPALHSIVYIPNPFIIPGGRFLEYYYWDSYWIIRGLLLSGMQETARGMLDNYLALVRQYGFIPNGGRIYYHGRSQPPLLIFMVKAYVEFTKNEKYALQALPMLELEFNNFTRNHAVEVQGRTMYRYVDISAGPRPESYREDVASAKVFVNDMDKEEHYSELKSACESGMDFTSRWFISDEGTNEGTLKDTKTRSIVPVELNAILFRSSKILAEFHRKAGNSEKAEQFQKKACKLVVAIRDVMWNEQSGIWLDYDLLNNKPRPYFSASNLSPLWARAFPLNDREKISKCVMDYIDTNNLDCYPGGVPNTLKSTGQQWDYPNVWPPMMFIVVEGLANLGTTEAKEMSKRWAHRWVKSNYQAYKDTGFMFEKYHCEKFGAPGLGGEYVNQTGYGWTNGVVIEFLAKYGKELSLCDDSDLCKCRPEPLKKTQSSDALITSEDNVSTD